MNDTTQQRPREGIDSPRESKALRLARYLKEFVRLRSTTVRDVEKYEAVLWFSEMPREPECKSPAWSDGFEPGDAWLEVRKQQFPKCPETPATIHAWIDQHALRQATLEAPQLRQKALLPDPNEKLTDGKERRIVEHSLSDHPEVSSAYERYRPNWEAWSAEYRRRAKIQSVYAELFRMHTQVLKQGEIVELVLGLGLLNWRSPGGPIRRHIVAARVDLHFDPASGLIRLGAAADGAQLRIEDDMLEAELRPDRGHYASVSEQLADVGDDVWDRALMHTALKTWAGALHADSQWRDGIESATDGGVRPVVSFAPALILRKRTQVGMARIYDSLIDQLSDSKKAVPSGWSSLIEDQDDSDDSVSPEGSIEQVSGPSVDAREIYFPLPANLEQRRIVDAIDRRRGVLVQGPPGTGKSHTIANLMCHLLATGKRVLITAETGHALKVLKDKLPEEIQPLCVSLLGQGGDAFAELNSAVQGITTRYSVYTRGAYDERIAEIDREIDTTRRTLASIDGELRGVREGETLRHSIVNGAYEGTAAAIANRVAAEREHFEWLRLPRESAEEPPLTEVDVATWFRIRCGYDDVAINSCKLQILPSEQLPAPADFANAVNIEREARDVLASLTQLRMHPAYMPILALHKDARGKLADYLRKQEEKRHKLDRDRSGWVREVLTAALGGRHALWQALRDQSHELIAQIDQSLKGLGSASISIRATREIRVIRSDAMVAIQHLEAGGKWKQWGFIVPNAIKERTYLREEIIVDGQPADTPERLQAVCRHVDFHLAVESLERVWADHGGLPAGSEPRMRLAALKEHVGMLDEALQYARECLKLSEVMRSTGRMIPEPDWQNGQTQEWLRIIEATEFEERHQLAAGRVTASLHALKAIRELHDAHPIVGTLINAIEQRDIAAYSQAHVEVCRIEQTRRDQLQRQQTEKAFGSAVPGLLDTVAVSLNDPAWTHRFRNWTAAWHWAVADNWLQKRVDRAYHEQQWQRRHDSEQAIRKLLAEAASLRAWRHFFNRLTTTEAAALKGWREAVRAMGRGYGRSARLERLRREARQYMDRCREAIPVWIMPRYLVAEMVDPLPGRYDLVIADEASQLGIESLFLFYIAKKTVVVGDDQQISPYGVGIADEAIAGLQQHYLEGIPHQHALSAQSSLYANAKIRFGQNVVLREHFRCMPEIIQFSNDLCYASNGTPLDPLRAYPANRLTPLVVRHVSDGYRTGSSQNALNEPEAEALLAQIVACINDPRYAGRTMGVISLQGEAQAKLIEHKLLERLEPEVIEQRKLICGDAYAFQGDERNIMFLSMVAAPNERIGALTVESARQRFNVAASRAQDQMWLFHSASLQDLSSVCMRHRLLAYMQNPGRRVTDELQQQFESQFERDVFQLITGRGFHVRTQVCVGDPTNHRYRIDLVVEGMQGRVAVECDGDHWHGPERYEQDMARQRDLERAGWQFVRIRGGDFYRNRGTALDPLWAELERLGIRPGGIDESAAEPPPPVDPQHMVRKEVDEVIEPSSPGGNADTPVSEVDGVLPSPEREDDQLGVQVVQSLAIPPQASKSPFATYVTYDEASGEDPRTVSAGIVAEGLCRIIEVEGPMVAKRAYDIYLRGSGIKRMGRELRSALNKALMNAIRQGKVISEDETGRRGLLYSVVRLKGSQPVRLRSRGPRTFEEIPPSEVQAAARQLAAQRHLDSGSDQHLRAVLECFDLQRLTTQVGTILLEIFDKKYPYTDDLLSDAHESSFPRQST